MPSHSCPKCHASMSEGFVVDNTYGGHGVSGWVEGKPVKSFWTGISLKGRKPVAIQSWRCNRCGYLESYAPIA